MFWTAITFWQTAILPETVSCILLHLHCCFIRENYILKTILFIHRTQAKHQSFYFVSIPNSWQYRVFSCFQPILRIVDVDTFTPRSSLKSFWISPEVSLLLRHHFPINEVNISCGKNRFSSTALGIVNTSNKQRYACTRSFNSMFFL